MFNPPFVLCKIDVKSVEDCLIEYTFTTGVVTSCWLPYVSWLQWLIILGELAAWLSADGGRHWVSSFHSVVEYTSRNSLPNMTFENKLVHLNTLTGSSSRLLHYERNCHQFSGMMVLFPLAGGMRESRKWYLHLKSFCVLILYRWIYICRYRNAFCPVLYIFNLRNYC